MLVRPLDDRGDTRDDDDDKYSRPGFNLGMIVIERPSINRNV